VWDDVTKICIDFKTDKDEVRYDVNECAYFAFFDLNNPIDEENDEGISSFTLSGEIYPNYLFHLDDEPFDEEMEGESVEWTFSEDYCFVRG